MIQLQAVVSGYSGSAVCVCNKSHVGPTYIRPGVSTDDYLNKVLE